MNDIVLSNGIRKNLLSLQSVAEQQQATQTRLATGKRVNSAVDNPINYFTNITLTSRADALKSLLDGMMTGIKTIESASNGIDGIIRLVQSLQATVRQAMDDAAQNRPVGTGTAGVLSTAGEVTATSKTLKQVAEDKFLWDQDANTAATAATTSTNGDLGLANTVNTFEISVGGTDTNPVRTARITLNATMTVRDLVNQINLTGIATASVNEQGQLIITGTGSDGLRARAGTAAAGNTTGNAALGLTAATFWATNGITATGSSVVRTNLIKQFNDVRTQIGELSEDAGFNGTNLLNGDVLNVVFNERTGSQRNTLMVQGYRLNADDIGILSASNTSSSTTFNIQNDTDLSATMDSLTNALTTLRGIASTLGSNLSMVQNRQEFTNKMITALKTGADNLVLADQNEEGAKLLALNTRQQLSQTALSLAAQADQSVLRLFG